MKIPKNSRPAGIQLLKPTHTLTWFSEKIKETETFGVGRLLSQKQFTIRRKRQLKQTDQTSRREENCGLSSRYAR